MNRTPVKSSAIASIGHENGILEVEYRGGRLYRLDGITAEEFDALLASESIGRALNAIKAGASFTKVEPEE